MPIFFIQLLGFAFMAAVFVLPVFACEQIPNIYSSSEQHTHGRNLRGEFDVIVGDNLHVYTDRNRVLLDAHKIASVPNDDKDLFFNSIKLKTVFAETASLETLTHWARSGLQSPLIAELREFWLGAMKSPFKLKLREPDKYLVHNGPHDS